MRKKDYCCPNNCGTELHYKQITGTGMRVKETCLDAEGNHTGKYYYPAYCPKCEEFFEMEK